MTPQTKINLDFDETPGWMPMGEDLPADFLDGNPAMVLATIAMMCMQPSPKDVEPHPQAIATLALFAIDCHATLTTLQFRRLEKTVDQYLDVVNREERFETTRNGELVKFVRDKAVERAQVEGLI